MTYFFSVDDRKTKSPISAVLPTVNHRIDSPRNSATSETPMDTHIPNGYKETAVKVDTQTEKSAENKEKLLNNLVKFVKDKLNTSTLSLAEFKKLLLLHPTGK